MKRKQSIIASLILFISVLFYADIMAETYTNPPQKGYFYIKSAYSGDKNAGYWDQKGSPARFKNMSILNLNSKETSTDQIFRFIPEQGGYYSIVSANGGYVTFFRVKVMGKFTSLIQFRAKSNSFTQRFRFKYTGNGKWKIYTYNKMLMSVPGVIRDTSRVGTSTDTGSVQNEWFLIDSRTGKKYTPASDQAQKATTPDTETTANTSSDIYNLLPGEQFVYGKIGMKDSGIINYTLAIVRKPNKTKQTYKREFDPYGPRPLSSGRVMKPEKNMKDYDRYDYWLIFNGEKFGPYDRIIEMYQNNADTDLWVDREGRKISFAGVKGQRYYPVINNQRSGSFWTAGQAPSFDRLSGQSNYILQWSQNDYRFVENFKHVLKGWKYLGGLKYADNKKDFIYIGGKDNKWERSVYLNHKKIAGPFYIVSRAGFIPGTNRVYIAGFDKKSNYKQILFGDKKINIPDGYGVENITPFKDRIIYTTRHTNKLAPKNNRYLRTVYRIHEYNLQTGNIKTYGDYNFAVHIRIFNNRVYYETYRGDKEQLIIEEGGKILERISLRTLNGQSLICRIAPDGTCYSYYKNIKKGGSAYKAGSYTFVVRKNGRPVNITGLNGKYPRIESLKFNKENSDIQLVIDLDKSVASKKKKIIYGDKSFILNGDTWDSNIHFADKGKTVYSIHRHIKSRNDWRWQLFKDGKPATKIFSSICAFAMSDDGSSYAILTGGGRSYRTENAQMHQKKELVSNGKVIQGTFGAPVWSPVKKKIIAIKQEGNKLLISEIN